MAERPRSARPRDDAAEFGAADRPANRLPSIVPLVLVVGLLLVVGLAATRGGGDTDPVLVDIGGSDVAAADPGETAATGESGATTSEGSADPAGGGATATGDADPDDAAPSGESGADDEVVDTAPEPTPTVDPETLPRSGSGELRYASASGSTSGAAPYRRFAVATERGSGVDPDEVAAFVDSVLADRRSWIGDGVTGFQRVGEGEPVDFTLVVATPDTVDRLCAPLQTAGRYSCATNGWIALNLVRWMTATPEWPSSLDVYRHYLVNHEVGHYILGPDHPGCPEPGVPAPIMMQQTIDLAGCLPNGWVYPDGTG